MSANEPRPGSDEAIDQGCSCPVMDNCHGEGFPVDGVTCFYYAYGCPIHNHQIDPAHSSHEHVHD